jgi:hypothetical protein
MGAGTKAAGFAACFSKTTPGKAMIDAIRRAATVTP